MTALRRSALLLLAVALSAATACASIDAPGTAGVVGTGEPTSVETGVGETENPSAEPDATENPADNGVLKSGIYEDKKIIGSWKISFDIEYSPRGHLFDRHYIFHADGRFETFGEGGMFYLEDSLPWSFIYDHIEEYGLIKLVRDDGRVLLFDEPDEFSWHSYLVHDNRLTIYTNDSGWPTHYTREG